MEGHRISAGRRLPLLDLKACGCHASSKGVSLAHHFGRIVDSPDEELGSYQIDSSLGGMKEIELTDDCPSLY